MEYDSHPVPQQFVHPYKGVVGNNAFNYFFFLVELFGYLGQEQGVLEETGWLRSGKQAPELPSLCSEFHT